jgi:hypothetical protein
LERPDKIVIIEHEQAREEKYQKNKVTEGDDIKTSITCIQPPGAAQRSRIPVALARKLYF